MSNVPGVLRKANDSKSLISHITAKEAKKFMNDGTITRGMIPKVASLVRAVQNGVKRAHILNGIEENALLVEVFTKTGIGTMVVNQKEKVDYLREIGAKQGAKKKSKKKGK